MDFFISKLTLLILKKLNLFYKMNSVVFEKKICFFLKKEKYYLRLPSFNLIFSFNKRIPFPL